MTLTVQVNSTWTSTDNRNHIADDDYLYNRIMFIRGMVTAGQTDGNVVPISQATTGRQFIDQPSAQLWIDWLAANAPTGVSITTQTISLT
jgi:hypothetical protein